jgi:hypothetical protein
MEAERRGELARWAKIRAPPFSGAMKVSGVANLSTSVLLLMMVVETPSFISQIPSEGYLHEYCNAYRQTGEV